MSLLTPSWVQVARGPWSLRVHTVFTEGERFAPCALLCPPRDGPHRPCAQTSPPGTLGAPCVPPRCLVLSLHPPQYGLYSAFMGCFVYFFLGTSRDVTLGPTAIMSLLVSFYTFREPAYAVLLAFLSGCIQLAMGFLHLGETLRPSCPGLSRHLPPGEALAFGLPFFTCPVPVCPGLQTLASLPHRAEESKQGVWPTCPQPHFHQTTSPSPHPPTSAGTGQSWGHQLSIPSWPPGFLLDFISYPVIKGFTSAATVTIGFGQIKVGTLVGSQAPPGSRDGGWLPSLWAS